MYPSTVPSLPTSAFATITAPHRQTPPPRAALESDIAPAVCFSGAPDPPRPIDLCLQEASPPSHVAPPYTRSPKYGGEVTQQCTDRAGSRASSTRESPHSTRAVPLTPRPSSLLTSLISHLTSHLVRSSPPRAASAVRLIRPIPLSTSTSTSTFLLAAFSLAHSTLSPTSVNSKPPTVAASNATGFRSSEFTGSVRFLSANCNLQTANSPYPIRLSNL